jgi:serine/threonine protein kinase
MHGVDFLITNRGLLKLADFGLARVYDPVEHDPLSHQVCTRQYRPPELLFASKTYTTSVDIWGLGVIFVELMALKTLFPGQNDIDQMFKVFQVLGTPDPLTWPVSSFFISYCPYEFITCFFLPNCACHLVTGSRRATRLLQGEVPQHGTNALGIDLASCKQV